jgi:hypothetical protein
MTLGFRRPIGSAADVKELEYISAIHQTDLQEVRSDGSIDGKKTGIIKGLNVSNSIPCI